MTGLIICLVIVAIGIIVAIVRWIGASVKLAKSVKDDVHNHKEKQAANDQWSNLMASTQSSPNPDSTSNINPPLESPKNA